MKINIREARLDELDILLDFEQKLINVERPMDPALKQQEKFNYYNLKELIESDAAKVYVALDGVQIVGSGYGQIRENKVQYKQKQQGYVGFMFVKEAYRGKGISQLVLNSIFEWFKSLQIKEVRLQVYSLNESAIKAYQKVGFKKYLVEMIHNL